MNSQFNLREAAQFSTSPFKPSKTSQMSPFQGLGNTQSSMLSRFQNNNPLLIGNNINSNFVNLNHQAASSVLIHPSNHIKCSNNQCGGSKSNHKDNQEESISSANSYAQYISNFDTSFQQFPTTSNTNINNQYFSNFCHGGFGHHNNNLTSQPFSFGGSSAFKQNKVHQIMNQHNLNCQQIPSNHIGSQNCSCLEEGCGNNNINTHPLGITSDNKKLSMEHLNWLEKKTMMKQCPQKTVNSKRKRDALLPPSTAASSLNDAEGSSSKILKKNVAERDSALSILANASGSSQQQEQLTKEDEIKVRTRGGLIEQMKLQREQILLQKEVIQEGDIQTKKNKIAMNKMDEVINDISTGEKPKKLIKIQEINMSQAKKSSIQAKQTAQIEKHTEQGSTKVQASSAQGKREDELGNQKTDSKENNQQERSSSMKDQKNQDIHQDKKVINGKEEEEDDDDDDDDDVEIQIEKDYEVQVSMKQHGQNKSNQSHLDGLNPEREVENEEIRQLKGKQKNNHKISNPKPKRTYRKQPKIINPIEQMNPQIENIEKEEISLKAKRADDIHLDEHIHKLLEEAEYMGRVYSLIGSRISGLVEQIRQQYLDSQLLQTFVSKYQQKNSQFISQLLPLSTNQQVQQPFLGKKTKDKLNIIKSPGNLRQSQP